MVDGVQQGPVLVGTFFTSAPAQGGPTGDKPVARAWRRRQPGRPLIRGATRWVSACSYGC